LSASLAAGAVAKQAGHQFDPWINRGQQGRQGADMQLKDPSQKDLCIRDEVAVLRRIPLFAHIDPMKLKLLAFTSERVAFEAGQTMFAQGAEGDAAYVIIDGQAEVLMETGSGPVQLAVIERSAIVGEVAILCDVPRTATLRAVTQLDTLRIAKEQFLDLLAEFPELAIEVMKTLALRLVRTNTELTDAHNRLRAAGL
jgi:CRP/FNR family transcriptional regulator, cyclic AMP receptor protein